MRSHEAKDPRSVRPERRSLRSITIVLLALMAFGCNENNGTSAGGVTAGQPAAPAPSAGAAAAGSPGGVATAGTGAAAGGGAAGRAGAGTGAQAAGSVAAAAGTSAGGAGAAGGAAGAAAGSGGGEPAAGAGVAGSDGAAGQPATAGSAAPTLVDYAKRGPYEVTTEKNVGGTMFRNTNVTDQTAFCAAFVGSIMLPGEGMVDEELTNYPADMDRQLYTMFRPTTFSEGKKYPVVTWGNGTCAQPLLYSEILEHLASHGIVVIATNSTSVGSGMEMQKGIDFVLAENARSGSPMFGKIDVDSLGASGHSQGSGAAVTVGGNARIKVTVPIQGASTSGVRALTGPTFLISGEDDTLATPASIESAFGAATKPAVYGMAVGQDHLMPGRMPEPILGALTTWFAIHLLKDDTVRPLFYGTTCGLCSDATWKVQRKNL
jgi:hypothetical protein